MTEHDDLSDGEYESIYGREALRARQFAQLDAILRHQEELLTTMQARIQKNIDPDEADTQTR